MQLLRKIERKKWIGLEHEWVPAGEFCADPLGDLGTAGGTLSVWRVDADAGCDEARIAAAIGALRNFGNVDYWLIDEQALLDGGFAVEACEAPSADPDLSKKSHRDIIKLTERSLLNLASLFREKGKPGTCTSAEIMQRLSAGIGMGTIARERVKDSWKKRMEQVGLLPP